jgi:UDP-glucose 4-epimerase
MGKRVLVTGLGTFWGGRVAQALERDPGVDVIIGLDTREPTVELDRTEFVRTDESYSILSRIVRATQVDTIVHTFLVVDSSQGSSRHMHEINVIGTMNLFAAASQPESKVCNVVVKSSTLVYGSTYSDPVWFTEDSRRSALPRHPVERSLLEVEGYVRDYAADNPDVSVSLLRFSNVLGEDIVTPITRALELPLVPGIFGFDPRLQFVHEDDVVYALEHCVFHETPGIYNVAADGVLALSEAISLLGKRPAPVLPPWGAGLLAGPLRNLGFRIPSEMLNLLRFGRGVDNRRFQATGFRYSHTSREAVAKFGHHLRVDPVMRGVDEGFTYEREVEEFLRWSPHVRRERRSEGVEADHEPLGI